MQFPHPRARYTTTYHSLCPTYLSLLPPPHLRDGGSPLTFAATTPWRAWLLPRTTNIVPPAPLPPPPPRDTHTTCPTPLLWLCHTHLALPPPPHPTPLYPTPYHTDSSPRHGQTEHHHGWEP